MTYKSDVGVMTYGKGLSPTGTIPKPHALTSAGGYTYQYDANGNMTQGRNKALTYDVENRLLQVNESGTITSFVYDGDGGRVSKSLRALDIKDVKGEAISTLYIGSLFEKDSSGKTRKHIFAGLNRIATISLSLQGEGQGEGVISYYHSDHLGSSNIITDSTGQQVQHTEYTPYGTIATNDVIASANSSVIASAEGAKQSRISHLFTGKELDSTGLYFYGARYYDPAIGRFITADTIVQAPYDPQSLNRYSYCRNNPINYIDPTGHSWKSFWKKWGGMFGIVGGVIKGAVTGDWSTLRNMGTAFVTSAILSWGNPYAIAASVLAAGFMDTPPGQQFGRFMSEDVFDDAFGMRPRAAYIVGNMVAYAIVTSGIYIGLTTIAPPAQPGVDYTNPANQGEISQYASDVKNGPGGSSANWMAGKGKSASTLTEWYPQGRLSSEVAFQDTPVLGKTLNALQIRHSAAVVNVGGKLVDSAKNVNLLKGQIFGAPWNGVCHQVTVRALVDGGMTGMQAVQTTASQVGWSFYLSSSIYGVEGHSGAVGIVNAEVNRRR